MHRLRGYVVPRDELQMSDAESLTDCVSKRSLCVGGFRMPGEAVSYQSWSVGSHTSSMVCERLVRNQDNAAVLHVVYVRNRAQFGVEANRMYPSTWVSFYIHTRPC